MSILLFNVMILENRVTFPFIFTFLYLSYRNFFFACGSIEFEYFLERSIWYLPERYRVDLGLLAMKRKSTHPRSTETKPHHQIEFNVIHWKHLLKAIFYSSAWDKVSLFLAPSTKWASIWNQNSSIHKQW